MLFKAAQYCNCPPWELLEKPVAWRNYALGFRGAEISAENEMMKAARK